MATLFDRTLFVYDEKSDTFRCPAQQTLARKQLSRRDRCVMYAAEAQVCGSWAMKNRCTTGSRRWITRHLFEDTLQRMNARATPEIMRLRRSTVERPFALLKYVIFGHPRFLLGGLGGAQIETSLAPLAYNLKTMFHVLGGCKLTQLLEE
ncbi:MAG TPA: transposase [Candidatus Dormibacteraeota bacterium]|nr:transposase [Candidatus Dormibacteraeota bacterium]